MNWLGNRFDLVRIDGCFARGKCWSRRTDIEWHFEWVLVGFVRICEGSRT